MKVLIVSPYFSPYSLVGSQRMNSFAEYLVNNGSTVKVISYPTEYYLSIDKESCKANVDNRIERVSFEAIPNIKSVFKRNRKFAKSFENCLERVLSKEKFDICLVSLGPFFTLKNIDKICKRHQVPYILDYRDFNSIERVRSSVNGIKRIKEKIIRIRDYMVDKKAITNATAVITVSFLGQERLERAFPKAKGKTFVVFNGYNDVELANKVKCEWTPSAEVSVGYFGKFLYYDISLGMSLLEGISTLRQYGINVKMFHIGPYNPKVKNMIDERHLDAGSYVYLGSKQYSEGVEMLKQMDCCAIEWDNIYGLGTKVFDYIYVNKPIIACVKRETELAKFLKNFQNVFLCNTQKDVSDALRKIKLKKCNLTEFTDLEQYSRTEQNKVMVNILERYSCIYEKE